MILPQPFKRQTSRRHNQQLVNCIMFFSLRVALLLLLVGFPRSSHGYYIDDTSGSVNYNPPIGKGMWSQYNSSFYAEYDFPDNTEGYVLGELCYDSTL